METVPIAVPAQASTTLALCHLNPGETVRRASFIGASAVTTPSSLGFSLYQYRSGVQVGAAALGTLTFGAGGIPTGLLPFEFALPQTLDAFQVFQEDDTLLLVVTQGGTAEQFTGILSWW